MPVVGRLVGKRAQVPDRIFNNNKQHIFLQGRRVTGEIELADKFDTMNKVVELKLQGQNLTKIAKVLGLTRVQVNEYYDMWRDLAQSSENMKNRAREALMGADSHYDRLIAELYDIMEKADDWQFSEGTDAKMLSVKANAIGKIAEFEAKRVNMLKDAGLLEDQELAQQILETERKHEILIGILRDVTSKCDHCSRLVAERLSQVTNEPMAVKLV